MGIFLHFNKKKGRKKRQKKRKKEVESEGRRKKEMFRNYQLLINYQNSYIFFRKIKKMKLGREKIRKKSIYHHCMQDLGKKLIM